MRTLIGDALSEEGLSALGFSMWRNSLDASASLSGWGIEALCVVLSTNNGAPGMKIGAVTFGTNAEAPGLRGIAMAGFSERREESQEQGKDWVLTGVKELTQLPHCLMTGSSR
mmetsp:Transcript_47189/g.111261  ORF Transcript_47189/g.111261 Transcript_47189/m.111261 type:complete len:113 (-) Transcript_47189:234-572(-)|eukprot:3307647-Rhodomonas_salina.3